MEDRQPDWERWARVIAEDMVGLAIEGKLEVSHFPLPANAVVDALPRETLVRIVKALSKLSDGSVPLGFALLFLLPRKIPADAKKGFFRKIVARLSEIRVDFSLRTSMEVRWFPYRRPVGGTGVSVSEYRKLVFLLENISELRVPVYRGWSFDAFAYGGMFYRVYNLGTLGGPKYVILSGKLLNRPSADVFGHVKVPENVTNTMIFGATPEEIVRTVRKEIESAGTPETFSERIEFVLNRWGEFLGVRLSHDHVPVQVEETEIRTEQAERYLDATYRVVMDLLTG